MRVTCPACGAELTLDAMLAHEGARRAVAAAMQISAPLADRLMKYLALFRPAKRQLTMDRLASLLTELLPMLQAQRVKRGAREYATMTEDWKTALDVVLAHRDDGRLKLPLKTHGYLLEVLCGLCERYESGQEEAREKARRAPHRELAVGAPLVSANLIAAVGLASAEPAGPRTVPAEAQHALAALGIGRRKAGD